MLVKFTNYADAYKDMPIYLNKDNIMSVYEVANENGSLVTCIYGKTGDTWNVEEGLEEAVRIINGWRKQ